MLRTLYSDLDPSSVSQQHQTAELKVVWPWKLMSLNFVWLLKYDWIVEVMHILTGPMPVKICITSTIQVLKQFKKASSFLYMRNIPV